MVRLSPAARGVPYFAAFLDLFGKHVVVVGGGKVASTKVRALLPCKPQPLVVIAPRVTGAIKKSAEAGELTWLRRPYVEGDLHGAALAFGATDEPAENARVAAEARRRGVPVLAVDDVPNCDFIAPALVRRGEVTIAISTGGRSPAMARRTRERLDQTLPQYWGDLLDVASAARQKLGNTRALIEPDRWQQALDGEVERLTEQGALDKATELLLRKLERTLFEPSSDDDLRPGHGSPDDSVSARGADWSSESSALVSLVGAGPGDPELLTLKAVKRLQAADVVIYDRLVSDGILSYVTDDAERINVGKTPGGGGWSQPEIDDLLVQLGRAGKRVVRLKGGDPFVFGRGGEEALALARAGVPFEVVPGVSSALAAPAAAGIPVTHRGLSGSVTIANGHDAEQHEWTALANSGGTLVFLMAVEHLEEIVANLLDAGRPADEPAAVVQWATTACQRSVHAPLADIARVARQASLEPPAVLIVGPTAALAQHIGPVAQRERPTKTASDVLAGTSEEAALAVAAHG
jgi:uroporphyrin-III C-methyltransferase/precorrin-2 dehydrogenase/sirohydrochlorin ferrochelatase